MPITNTASFAQYRRNYAVSVTTANTDFATPTNTGLLSVAGPDGALITRLTAMPKATVTNSNLQVYLSKDGGTTFNLLTSAQMPAATLSLTGAISPTVMTQTDGSSIDETNPISLGGVTDFGTTAPTWGGVTLGSANAQTLPFATGVTALTAGIIVDFEAGFTNTTSATLTVGTSSAASIVRDSTGAALSAGDLTTGFRYRARCDGTFWRLFMTDRLYVATSVTLATGIVFNAQQADF